MAGSEDISFDKKTVRREILAKRRLLSDKKARSLQICHILQKEILPALPVSSVIAVFYPLADEVDLLPFYEEARRLHYHLALPETPEKGQKLIFRYWPAGALMTAGKFKTFFPQTEVVTPDYALFPLLAFTRTGERLGYGGGYYDYSLAFLPEKSRTGVAFSVQEYDSLPTEPYDLRLGQIITEREVIRCFDAKTEKRGRGNKV